MKKTNRQIISDVISELRVLSVDEMLSKRFVLSKLKDKTKTAVKQDVDTRRLLKISSVWRDIKCFELCEIPFSECACDIPNCTNVMKSKKPLPKAFDSNYGTLIKVFTINGAKEYHQTKLNNYISIKSRPFQRKQYFWLDADNYLYIPDSSVESVLVYGLFHESLEVDKLNDKKGSDCAKILDSEFVCPEHLVDIVKTQVIKELFEGFRSVVVDEKPDLNSNSKQ